ncbi:MAG: hypothetical protein JOS17DRAFT_114969 [Linnemannia elongata]|nr:MAG: hypothetical protein JOS17DRAFT_114969 [Linnemannia elongata]
MQEGSYFYSVSVSSSLALARSRLHFFFSSLFLFFSSSSLFFSSSLLSSFLSSLSLHFPSFPFHSSLYPIVTISPRFSPRFSSTFDFFLNPFFPIKHPFSTSPFPLSLSRPHQLSYPSLSRSTCFFAFSPSSLPFLPLSLPFITLTSTNEVYTPRHFEQTTATHPEPSTTPRLFAALICHRSLEYRLNITRFTNH